MSSFTTLLLISLCFFVLSFNISIAQVPASETFTYVNEGDLNQADPDTGLILSEYAPTYRPLDPFTTPFQLCFYNTTPNAYFLGLRMGVRRSRSLMRWVWEANRGRPVRENATFSLGSNGNLVLADADGKVAWQSNTANKGVVGFAILSDGNMVLRDSNGSFVWQSFDSPTDTLLVGQSLRVNGGPYRLVSRDSVTNNVDGAYSFVIEPKRLGLYYKNNMSYWAATLPFLRRANVNLIEAKFRVAEAEYEENNFHEIDISITNNRPIETPSLVMGTVLYNSTLSYLRLGIDGNIRVFTYRPDVRGNAWREIYTMFDREVSMVDPVSGSGREVVDECQLPNRCGKFGLCENSQCVGCPAPNGVFAWSNECDSKPPGCNASGFRYYELKGVDHFTVRYTSGSGRTPRSSCENRCTKDCKCLGYFYNTDSTRCWVVSELKTLTRVGNSTHLAYIKTPIA